MKKQLLTIVAAGAVGSLFAQLPASTTPQNKKAVLTEYTGIHCGYCPDGHKIATTIYNADPTNVVLINVHQGSFATPGAGEPDFRTADGNSIATMTGMGITGYPAGDMNRTVLAGSQTAGGMATGRGSWTTNAATIKGQSAYCNVAVQGTLDAVTRVLSVQAQVYYTANSPVGSNSLSIVLLEDKVPGPQSDYGNYNPTNWNSDGTYNHNHMLRKVVTPTFGTTIPTTTSGTTWNSPIYTYTVPAIYGAGTNTNTCMLGRLEIAAFVTETNVKTINAARGPLTLVNIPNQRDVAPINLSCDAQICNGPLNNIKFSFMNNGSATVTNAVFSYNVNGGAPQTFTYTGSVNPLSLSSPIALPSIAVPSPLSTNTLNLTVVSVNGASDQNTANDNALKTAPLSTVVANSVNMQMDFTQDQYGSEVGWGVYDELTMVAVTGATIAPNTYPNLAASGTQLHTHTFTINPNKCYKLVVTDVYGDGVNGGYGVGGYVLSSGASPIITSNGQYGKGENKWYKSAVSAGIGTSNINIESVNVYPNPAVNAANINIEMAQNENVAVTIVNNLGQVVYTESLSLNAGSHTIKLNTENWAAGLYNINMSTSKGSATQKLTISK